MSNPFSQVFKHRSYHNMWDKQIKYAELRTDIPEEIRKEWVFALKFLCEEFGKGFLKSCKSGHPIQNRINNKALWQINELIEFVKILKKFKSLNCNYFVLKDKLLPFEKCIQEGIPFIDIAKSFLDLGFELQFIEEIQGQKNADILINNDISNDKIYIEVSKLENSKEQSIIHMNSYKIFEVLHSCPFVLYYCKQLKIIPIEDLNRVVSDIFKIKNKAYNNNDLLFYNNEYIELIVAHDSKKEEIERYCNENNSKLSDFIGLPLNFKEVYRIVKTRRIEKEAKQIPKNDTGLIYIPINPLFFMATDLNEAIDILEPQMTPFKNLFGVVIYSKIMETVEYSEQLYNGHFYSRKMINDNIARDLFFIRNKEYYQNVSDITIKKIYESFQ